MKAILVIDMPNGCDECQFCGFGGKDLEKYVCCLTREHSDDTHMVGCPLKPMPKRFEPTIITDYCLGSADGWNACIDEILGEENG